MKKTFFLFFIFCLAGKFTMNSFGQYKENSLPTESVESYDPIAAQLDSLVSLANVIRYNNLNSGDNSINGSDYSIPSFSDEIYKERIAKISTPIPLTFNNQVKNYIDLYAFKKRALTSRVLGLSKFYFPLFEEALDRNALPLEFKYLSVVESALNPIAVSRVGATGLWQFMYNTGKLYDLKVNSYIDERRDPYLATQAACRYFKEMYDIYHDWLLVIAAYNCGAGNVNRAIARSGGKTNFWEISPYLPSETRGYVPAFIAVCYVMNYASDHNIFPVTPAYSFFEVDTVGVNEKLSFRQVSSTIDLPYDVISFLNPIYKKGFIPGNSDFNSKLRLPMNKIAMYVTNSEKIRQQTMQEEEVLAASYQPQFTWQQVKKWYTVRKGESLKQVAQRNKCSVNEIKKLNHLASNKIRRGQKLQVYAMVKVKNPAKDTEVTATNLKPTEKRDSGNVKNDLTARQDIKKDSSDLISSDSSNNEAAEDLDALITGDSDDINSGNVSASVNKPADAVRSKVIYHLVQPGDTLWNIARRYEATVEQIKSINKLSGGRIKVGTKLKVQVG